MVLFPSNFWLSRFWSLWSSSLPFLVFSLLSVLLALDFISFYSCFCSCQFLSGFPPLCASNEVAALHLLQTSIRDALRKYPTTLQVGRNAEPEITGVLSFFLWSVIFSFPFPSFFLPHDSLRIWKNKEQPIPSFPSFAFFCFSFCLSHIGALLFHSVTERKQRREPSRQIEPRFSSAKCLKIDDIINGTICLSISKHWLCENCGFNHEFALDQFPVEWFRENCKQHQWISWKPLLSPFFLSVSCLSSLFFYQDDDAIIHSPSFSCFAPNFRNCVLLRHGEKEVLNWFLEWTNFVIPFFSLPSPKQVSFCLFVCICDCWFTRILALFSSVVFVLSFSVLASPTQTTHSPPSSASLSFCLALFSLCLFSLHFFFFFFFFFFWSGPQRISCSKEILLICSWLSSWSSAWNGLDRCRRRRKWTEWWWDVDWRWIHYLYFTCQDIEFCLVFCLLIGRIITDVGQFFIVNQSLWLLHGRSRLSFAG